VAGGLGRQVTAAHVKATMLIVVVYAISDELHQLFVPLRTADVRDALADVAGASIALLACWAWHIIAAPRNRLPKPQS
jgi:VanZ family protein